MFPERLREMRKKHGFTQLELSIKLDVAKSTIAGYEKGNRKPKLKTLNKMAAIFNTSADYLLGITDDKSPNKSTKDLDQILREEDYHYKGRRVSNKDLDFLLQYLERINENIENDMPISNDQEKNRSENEYKTHNSDSHTEPVQFL